MTHRPGDPQVETVYDTAYAKAQALYGPWSRSNVIKAIKTWLIILDMPIFAGEREQMEGWGWVDGAADVLRPRQRLPD